MLIRLWRGWTPAASADEYAKLLNGEIAPNILARGIAGLHDLQVWRRAIEDHEQVEFVTVMRFDDWPAVAAFAGDRPTGSVVPPEARRLLARYDSVSQHFDLVRTHAVPQPDV